MSDLLTLVSFTLLLIVPFIAVLRGCDFLRCVVYCWLTNAIYVAFVALAYSDLAVFIAMLMVGWIPASTAGLLAILVRHVVRAYFKREVHGATKPVEPTGTSALPLHLITSHTPGKSPGGSLRR